MDWYKCFGGIRPYFNYTMSEVMNDMLANVF